MGFTELSSALSIVSKVLFDWNDVVLAANFTAEGKTLCDGCDVVVAANFTVEGCFKVFVRRCLTTATTGTPLPRSGSLFILFSVLETSKLDLIFGVGLGVARKFDAIDALCLSDWERCCL